MKTLANSGYIESVPVSFILVLFAKVSFNLGTLLIVSFQLAKMKMLVLSNLNTYYFTCSPPPAKESLYLLTLSTQCTLPIHITLYYSW